MGYGLRGITAALVVAATVAVAGPAAAQTGAGQGLASPTGNPPPATEAPAGAGYVPPPPAYGGPRLEMQPERAEPVVTGDRTQKHVGNVLSVIGGAVFANAYLSMALAWLAVGPDWMVVPIIGPFAMIAEDGAYDQAVFWIDGVLQLAGAVAMAVGLGLRFSFEEGPQAAEAQLTPWLGPGGGGLGISATF